MSAHTTVTDPFCGMSVTADPGTYLPSGEHTHTH